MASNARRIKAKTIQPVPRRARGPAAVADRSGGGGGGDTGGGEGGTGGKGEAGGGVGRPDDVGVFSSMAPKLPKKNLEGKRGGGIRHRMCCGFNGTEAGFASQTTGLPGVSPGDISSEKHACAGRFSSLTTMPNW